MKTLTCPICDAAMRIKPAKNEKPYAECKGDGLQILIRLPAGIERFNARYGTAWKGGAPAEAPKPAPAAKSAAKKTPTPPPAPKKETVPPTEPAKKKEGLFGF